MWPLTTTSARCWGRQHCPNNAVEEGYWVSNQSQTPARQSRAIFQQDGAPVHPARKAQDWCNANFPGFWEKGTLPDNSPELTPIEDLWAIVNQELSKLSQSSLERTLFQNAQTAWPSVKGEIPDNLMRHAGAYTAALTTVRRLYWQINYVLNSSNLSVNEDETTAHQFRNTLYKADCQSEGPDR